MDDELLNQEGTTEEGEPVDTGEASDSPPVDEEEVPPVEDDGNRPDVDWDVTPDDGDADPQQTFTSQPVPPYNPGDIWVNGTTEYACVTAKAAGEAFSQDDWSLTESDYVPPTPVTKTVTVDTVISDFSAEALAELEASGAVPIAVYDDGTEEQVTWADVFDPSEPGIEVASEADAVAKATNQHFWHRVENTDGLGAGAFVTDETQDDFIAAGAQGFPTTKTVTDTFTGDGETTVFYLSTGAKDFTGITAVTINGTATTNYDIGYSGGRYIGFRSVPPVDAEIKVTWEYNIEWHNLLMNSFGILLRRGLNRLASFTQSAIAFYDGLGNSASNIVAQFGAYLARIGKAADKHVDITSSGIELFDNTTSLANFGADNARIGEEAKPHLNITSSAMGFYPASDNTDNNAYFLANASGTRAGQVGTNKINTYTTSNGFNIRSNTTNVGAFAYAPNSTNEFYIAPLSTETGAFDIVKLTTNNTTANLSSAFYIDTPNFSVGSNSGLYIGTNHAGMWGGSSEFYITTPTSGIWFSGNDARYFFTNNHIFPPSIPIGARNTIRFAYSLPERTGDFMRIVDGTSEGSAVVIGAGGRTIIGGGESAPNLMTELGTAQAETEAMDVASDGAVFIHANCNTIANRKTSTFNTAGHLFIPNNLLLSNDNKFDVSKNPSSAQTYGELNINYLANSYNVRSIARYQTNGNITHGIEVGRYINSAWTWNSININVSPTGVRSYSVTDPVAFRKAVRIGTASIASFSAAKGKNTKTVTLDQSMGNATYAVFLTLENSTEVSGWTKLELKVTNKTTTQVTVEIYNDYTAAVTTGTIWVLAVQR